MAHEMEVTRLTEQLRRCARPLGDSGVPRSGGAFEANPAEPSGEHVHDSSTTATLAKLNGRALQRAINASVGRARRKHRFATLVRIRLGELGTALPAILGVRYFVYALVDPRDGLPHYVGRTTNPALRMTAHISDLGRYANKRKKAWILELKALGLRPELEVLEETYGAVDAHDGEAFWVAHGRRAGWPLTNGHGKSGAGSFGRFRAGGWRFHIRMEDIELLREIISGIRMPALRAQEAA